MQRGRPNTLSILERAQGQLSGKRFGKATTKQSQSIAYEDNEEDELKVFAQTLVCTATNTLAHLYLKITLYYLYLHTLKVDK